MAESTRLMSPWGSVRNQSEQLSPEDQLMVELGMKALNSGQVSPETALKNAPDLKALAKGKLKEKAQTFPKPAPTPTPQPNAVTVGEQNPLPSLNAMGNPSASPMQSLQPLLNGSSAIVPGGRQAGAPGAEAKNELGAQQRAGQTTSHILTMEPDQYQQLAQTVMAQAPYQAQERGARGLELGLQAAARTPSQVDLSPVAALIDSLYGSKLQSGYKRPETADDKRAKILAYADEIQKRRGEMAKSVMEGVKGMKAGSQTDILQQLLTERLVRDQGDPAKGAGRGNAADLRIREKELRDSANKVTDKFAPATVAVNEMQGALDTNDYQQVAASLSSLSRMMGEKGVLTEGDIRRLVPANYQGSLHKFLAYFGETPTTQMNPAYAKSLRSLVGRAKENIAKQYELEVNSRKTGFKNSSSKNLAIDPTFAPVEDAIKGFKTPNPKPNSAPKPAAMSKPPAEWTDKDFQEMEAYTGKK